MQSEGERPVSQFVVSDILFLVYNLEKVHKYGHSSNSFRVMNKNGLVVYLLVFPF